ncbi:MAG: glycosyltransferase family 2 protein [candidate division SR1 bacterium]|nr:glycosyltransferase family 2 protein [candidate division SR1 bacterium]
MQKKIISLIIPCFNEEQNVAQAHSHITTFWKTLKYDFDYELVFVDDGSRDSTVLEIEKLAKKDSQVKLVQFSRNFGKEIATTAGIQNCNGDACIMYDADLQYPIEKLPDFLDKWENGADVVVGIRDKKKTNNFVEKFGSMMFYKCANLIAEVEIKAGALDFRLMDRVVIEEFSKFTERGRMTRALIDWLGFKRDYIYYTENERFAGEASYSFDKRVKLAFSTFLSTSLFPLKFAGYLGIWISIITGPLGIIFAINKYMLGDMMNWNTTGATQVGILTAFLIGINLMCMGLISLYIANIHTEVANRPLYVVKNKINLG